MNIEKEHGGTEMTNTCGTRKSLLEQEDEANPRYCMMCGTRLGLYQRTRVCGAKCFNEATKK